MKIGSKTEPYKDPCVVSKKNARFFWGAAILLCLLLYGWFSYAVQFGIGRYDEPFYLTLPQRISLGDRFILHEWFFTQFSAIFQYLHYTLFVKLVGSTEGIILHFRYTFLLLSFFCYWVIIYQLRKTPVRALISAFLFCGFVPFAIFAPNYYNLPPFLCMLICFLLIGNRGKYDSVKQVLCGVLLSAAVLLAPTLALLYFLYTGFVILYYLLKKKGKNFFASYDFLLGLRTWGFITVGVAVCAGVVLIYLAATSGLGKIIQAIPLLFNNSEYNNADLQISMGSLLLQKTKQAIYLFHPVNAAAAGLLLLAGFLFKKNKRRLKTPFYWKIILLILSFFTFIAACICAVIIKSKNEDFPIYWWYHSFCTLPVFFLCLMCRLLCSEKDPKKDLFWQTGFFLALFRDLFSNVSLGIGCILCVIPLPFFFAQVLRELRADFSALTEKASDPKAKGSKNLQITKKAFASATVCFMAFFLCWSMFNVYAEGMHLFVEKMHHETVFNAKITEGPYKGVYTGEKVKRAHDLIVSDMKKIDSISKPTDAVYITDLCPLFYLYLGRPYSAYSSWFVGDDLLTRQIPYWQLYPEKLPSVIYVPNYTLFFESNVGRLNFQQIENLVEYDAVQGAGGTILIVKGWHLPSPEPAA